MKATDLDVDDAKYHHRPKAEMKSEAESALDEVQPAAEDLVDNTIEATEDVKDQVVEAKA